MENEPESSDSDNQSDEDYRPNEQSDVSEIDSDDDIEDEEIEYNKQKKPLSKKRTKKQPPNIIKNKYKKLKNERNKETNEKEINEEKNVENSEEQNELNEKKRSDELWAIFNNINSTKSATSTTKSTVITTSTTSTSTTTTTTTKMITSTTNNKITNSNLMNNNKKYEFAGEIIEVEKSTLTKPDVRNIPTNSSESISTTTTTTTNTVTTNKFLPLRGRSSVGGITKVSGVGGGLASVLGQLGKKNKINSLEKSKLDWDSFKKREGIDADLLTHNKGKDGFLEKKDFLERTDLKQFEIEKKLRQATRSSNR